MSQFDDRAAVGDDDAVRALYEACAGMTPWCSALQAANEAIGAQTARLLIVDSRTRQLLAAEEAGNDDERPTADATRAFDEHLRSLWSRRAGEALCIASPVVAERDCDGDGTSFIAGKVREHPRQVAFVSFARTRRSFTAAEFARGARYVRHIASAMRITQQCEDMKTVATVGERIIQTSSRPILVLGRDKEVLAANAPARAMLRTRDIICIESGVVRCVNGANDGALSKVLDRFTSERASHEERRRRAAVKLAGDRGKPILCSVSNMVPEEPSPFDGEQPVALLAFASLEVSEAQMDAEFLASLYDFTRAELRVVEPLLRGEGLLQIASRNAISLATVRTQLKSVFAKTNTHRQAQVVQLLLMALLL